MQALRKVQKNVVRKNDNAFENSIIKNEQPKVMLPVINESNHSAVVRASTNKEIKTSITTENMRLCY